MNFIRYILIIIIVSCLNATTAHAWTGKVVGISDGDIIKVLRDGKQVKIRLYGVDTPEKAQAFGNKAKQFTAALVAGKVVDVETVTTDKYGRTVGLVTVEGKLLHAELVKAGMAWVYRKYCDRQPLCNDLMNQQSKAKANGVGLWSTPNPQPPWDWRHAKKNQMKKSGVDTGPYQGNVKSQVFTVQTVNISTVRTAQNLLQIEIQQRRQGAGLVECVNRSQEEQGNF